MIGELEGQEESIAGCSFFEHSESDWSSDQRDRDRDHSDGSLNHSFLN